MSLTVQDFSTVLRFAWKYMRPYWTRLAAGIVLGCLCGLTASSFIWATRTLAGRLETPKPASERVASETVRSAKSTPAFGPWEMRVQEWQRAVDTAIDPWLPRVGVELNWQRIVGCLLLL